VLVLLTLQSSFLLPPFGYALMMVRDATRSPAPFRSFLKALLPFLVAQWILLLLLLLVLLLVPRLVHIGEDAGNGSRNTVAPVSNEAIDKLMRDMIPAPPAYEPK
jgi:hypothetical protein